jgi:hypothetical protein
MAGTRLSRTTVLAVAGVLVAGTAVAVGATVGGGTADAEPSLCDLASRYSCVREGDLLEVALDELRPTQAVLGQDEIYYKLGRYRSTKDEDRGEINKRFDDWCETNGQGKAKTAGPFSSLDDPASFECEIPVGEETEESRAEMKTAVIGPGDTLYLTDGHHTLSAFWETPDAGPRMRIRVRITDDLSDLDERAFWQEMERARKVWLRDENDQPITVDQLPGQLDTADFGDDAYRGLVFFTRDIGYAKPEQAPEFLEFYWGSWLRRNYDLREYDLSDHKVYLDLIKQASRDMAGLEKSDVVADGKTAEELGKLGKWNDGEPTSKGEFDKLSEPMSDEKPGKLAFALDYKNDL